MSTTDILPVNGKVYWEERDDGLKPVMYNTSTEKYEDIIWTPQAGSQEAFLRAGHYEVLYSGTRGPGKTDALLMDYCQFVGKGLGPDWRGILFRRTYPELGDVIAKSRKWFPQIFPGAKYHAGEHYWTFPDGETLLFRHFKTPDDYWNYHGHAYPWMGWEELTSWPSPDCYTSMMSCARSANPQTPIRLRSTTNPYGCIPHGEVLTSEHGWVDIKDILPGDTVVSVDKHGNPVNALVSKTIEQAWDGDLVTYKNRGMKMEFTPDHRFAYLMSDGTHRMQEYHTFRNIDIMRRTSRRKEPGKVFDTFGLFIGLALMNARVKEVAGKKYVEIESSTETCHDAVGQLNMKWTYDRGLYRIDNEHAVLAVEQMGKAHKRIIPHAYRNCVEVMLGTQAMGPAFYTDSTELVDQIAELAAVTGFAFYSKYRVGTYEIYTRGPTSLKFLKTTTEHFKGPVYCLTVPETETFFVRQNGSVWLSGNSGHSWVKHRWRLPAPQNRMCSQLITDSVDKNGDIEPPRIAIMGHIRENHVLLFADPGYIGRIKSSARNHAELEAWLNGSWDIVAGGMFDDLWEPNIHVLPNFPLHLIPKGWRMDRSYDHGQSHPFSVGWWGESNGEPVEFGGKKYGTVRGDLIRIAEWYGWTGEPNVGARMLTSEIAKGILDRENQMGIYGRVKTGIADGSIFDEYEPGLSVVGEMRKNGVDWYAADKGPGSRKQGWEQIRERLQGAKPGDEGVREEPGLFILETCDQFLRTIPVLPRSDRDLDDADTSAEDHIADEARYRVRFKSRRMRRGSWK